MSDDDPFAEPSDTERTVIRPNPGGRRAPVPPPTGTGPNPSAAAGIASVPAPPAGASPGDRQIMEAGYTGMNQLNAAATPLFALISRIKNRAQHNDPEAMRQATVAEIRTFESRAVTAGVDPQQVKVARYAIAATLDDVVLNTPWGSNSSWAQKSMVSTFHREVVGGDRFYDVLAKMEQEPAGNIDLLEFMYMCLSLGFEGRLRVEAGGPEKHREVRQGLAAIIRNHRGPLEADLSPNWEGVDKRHREVSFWRPFWATAAVLAAALGIAFAGFSTSLNANTRALVDQMATLLPSDPPSLGERPPFQAPTPEVVRTQIETVSGFLQAEIDDGLITVFKEGNAMIIRLNGSNMFASASDRLNKAFEVPIQRIASALNSQEGPILIVGHTDSDGIRSRRFASNMELSIARADMVRQRISGLMDEPVRVKAEGQADRHPVVPNTSRENKARNRRIEFVLIQEDEI